ncbi:hypothetical protein B0H14DRAFT_2631485 [Mycena olivaceomarginata]|nr:hypothetical protein B0H14DRAFT_2631485 [Mycena olivaceomarginata]
MTRGYPHKYLRQKNWNPDPWPRVALTFRTQGTIQYHPMTLDSGLDFLPQKFLAQKTLYWFKFFSIRNMIENMMQGVRRHGSRYNVDEIDGLDEKTIQKIRCQRTAVLNAYPLNEILELYSSVCFLRGLLEDIMKDELTRTEEDDASLTCGWTSSCPLALPVCCKPGKSAITKCSLKIWASVMVNAPASRV